MLVILFVIATAAMTYPLAFNLKDHIPGFNNTDEPYGVIWEMWWFRFSRLNGLNHAACDFVGAPFGRDLGNIAGSVYLWVGIRDGLALVAGAVTAYNIFILLSFLLTLIITYYLVFYMTGSFPASILSALIFSFCPYHFARAWQHLSLAQMQWLPLYVLGLLKLKNGFSKWNVLFVAAALFLLASFNFYYAYFATVITVVFLTYCLGRTKDICLVKRLVFNIFLAGIIVTLLLLPAFYDIYKWQRSADRFAPAFNVSSRTFDDLFAQSAKPLS
ncbi:MAG: YfhO family protein, partial [Candidatus Omnitrophica bacterium]|nr:YfhO family protein [Candidatus Omnitrophota bacterium]